MLYLKQTSNNFQVIQPSYLTMGLAYLHRIAYQILWGACTRYLFKPKLILRGLHLDVGSVRGALSRRLSHSVPVALNRAYGGPSSQCGVSKGVNLVPISHSRKLKKGIPQAES